MRFASRAVWVLALSVLALSVPQLRADDTAAPGINPALMGDYRVMAQQLKLSDDQQTQLADLAKQKLEAVNKWKADNDAQTLALREKMKSDNEEDAKQARHDYAELATKRHDLEAGYDAKINALLTPDQALTWETYKLNRDALKMFDKAATLTDEQKATIKTMAAATAAAITKLTSPDVKTLEGLKKQFTSDIHDKVLTDAQRKVVDAERPHHTPKNPTPASATPPPAPPAAN